MNEGSIALSEFGGSLGFGGQMEDLGSPVRNVLLVTLYLSGQMEAGP